MNEDFKHYADCPEACVAVLAQTAEEVTHRCFTCGATHESVHQHHFSAVWGLLHSGRAVRREAWPEGRALWVVDGEVWLRVRFGGARHIDFLGDTVGRVVCWADGERYELNAPQPTFADLFATDWVVVPKETP